MPRLEFFNTKTGELLPFDREKDSYVYRQYKKDGWFVRVNGAPSIVPYVKIDDTYYSLVAYGEQGYTWPEEQMNVAISRASWSAGYQDAHLGSFAAWLQFYRREPDNRYTALSPTLYIKPAMREQHFDEIVRRLQHLALIRSSPTRAFTEVKGALLPDHEDENKAAPTLDAKLIALCHRFLSFCASVEASWRLIRNTPAKDVKRQPGIVDLNRSGKALSASLVQKACQRPDVQRLEVLLLNESFDNLENRFLVYLLDEISKEARQLIDTLQARIERQDADKLIINQLHSLLTKLEVPQSNALAYKTEPFLRSIRPQADAHRHPTRRLTDALGYGSAYHAYQSYKQEVDERYAIKRGIDKAEALKAVHPVHRLYEVWVFIEVYELLTTRFNFIPIDHESKHPLDLIEVHNDALIEQSLIGKTFRLQFVACNDASMHFELKLYYNCSFTKPFDPPGLDPFSDVDSPVDSGLGKWKYLKPDILLELNSCMYFALDAKYRGYGRFKTSPEAVDRNQSGRTCFEEDLFGTARDKYLNVLGCTASFIVHSDEYHRYEYWGECPWSLTENDADPNALNRGRVVSDEYPNHTYGAIRALPGDLTSLEQLLASFFLYHAKIYDICWPCGRYINEVGDRPWHGKEYKCDTCHASWVKTNCRANKTHVILKKVSNWKRFHRVQPGPLGYCICPQCGNRH